MRKAYLFDLGNGRGLTLEESENPEEILLTVTVPRDGADMPHLRFSLGLTHKQCQELREILPGGDWRKALECKEDAQTLAERAEALRKREEERRAKAAGPLPTAELDAPSSQEA